MTVPNMTATTPVILTDTTMSMDTHATMTNWPNTTMSSSIISPGGGSWFNEEDSIAPPIIKCCIGFMGITGNLLVCIVVIGLWSSNKRNATNTLIANQAMIDLVASSLLFSLTLYEVFKVPPPKTQPFAELVCKFWSSRMLLFGIFASSTFNLTLISMERYLAVVHPIYYSTKFASTMIAKLLPGVPWLIGPIWQFVIGMFRYTYVPKERKCTYEAPQYTEAMGKVFGVIVFLWEYFIPSLIMTYAFVKIAHKFREQDRKVGNRPPRAPGVSTVGGAPNVGEHQNSISVMDQNSPMEQSIITPHDANDASRNNRSQGPKKSSNIQRKNVTKTLFVVFIFFFICWSPDQWAFLQYNLGGKLDFSSVFAHFAIVLAQLNSCVNPFIYGLQYRAYRQGLKKLICKCRSVRR